MNMQTRVVNLQTEINDANTIISESKGQLKLLMEQLQTKYGCKTVEDAKILHSKKVTEIEKIESELNDKVTEIEDMLNDFHGKTDTF